MKSVIVTILIFFAALQTLGQQEALFTHYSFNTLGVNPGYAGSRNALTVTGLHRSQWVTFPGAPITQTLTLHAPVFNEKIGLGMSFLNDQIGPSNSSGVFADFAYKIKIGKKGKLAFGLKGGVTLRSDQLGDLEVIDNTDPNFEQSVQNQLLPNFGAGLYYNLPNFYVGISSPRLLQNTTKPNEQGLPGVEVQARHYYFITGAVFNISKSGNLKLKPSTFVKITAGAAIEIDLTTLFYYKDFLWAGPMFRTGDAVGALAGLSVTDQFSFGYSFDWSYGNSTARYNGGSHEIMLRYDFIFNEKAKIESPRHF